MDLPLTTFKKSHNLVSLEWSHFSFHHISLVEILYTQYSQPISHLSSELAYSGEMINYKEQVGVGQEIIF